MKPLLILLSLLFFLSCKAQNNTLKFPENATPLKATLSEVSWNSGHWKGEAFGGVTEKIWGPPSGKSMLFSFKSVIDGDLVFYEVGGIREMSQSLTFQLKHFGKNFKGWEEKEETNDTSLIKIEGNRAYFDKFTFEKVNDNELNSYVVIEENGKSEEFTFIYIKQECLLGQNLGITMSAHEWKCFYFEKGTLQVIGNAIKMLIYG